MLIAPFDDNFDVVIVGTGSVDPRAPSAIELSVSGWAPTSSICSGTGTANISGRSSATSKGEGIAGDTARALGGESMVCVRELMSDLL
jgi:hypothetical protein